VSSPIVNVSSHEAEDKSEDSAFEYYKDQSQSSKAKWQATVQSLSIGCFYNDPVVHDDRSVRRHIIGGAKSGCFPNG